MDFSDFITAVDFAPVVAAILAVGAVKVAPLAVAWGTRKLLGMIGR
jgi:hypothetical protein